MRVISIADDYTPYLGGRFRSDGLGNGTTFREEYLVPILEQGSKAIVKLDGPLGYPSSFLEEAFGGLVRKGFKPEIILNTFEFQYQDPSLGEIFAQIQEYIMAASAEKN